MPGTRGRDLCMCVCFLLSHIYKYVLYCGHIRMRYITKVFEFSEKYVIQVFIQEHYKDMDEKKDMDENGMFSGMFPCFIFAKVDFIF